MRASDNNSKSTSFVLHLCRLVGTMPDLTLCATVLGPGPRFSVCVCVCNSWLAEPWSPPMIVAPFKFSHLEIDSFQREKKVEERGNRAAALSKASGKSLEYFLLQLSLQPLWSVITVALTVSGHCHCYCSLNLSSLTSLNDPLAVLLSV